MVRWPDVGSPSTLRWDAIASSCLLHAAPLRVDLRGASPTFRSCGATSTASRRRRTGFVRRFSGRIAGVSSIDTAASSPITPRPTTCLSMLRDRAFRANPEAKSGGCHRARPRSRPRRGRAPHGGRACAARGDAPDHRGAQPRLCHALGDPRADGPAARRGGATAAGAAISLWKPRRPPDRVSGRGLRGGTAASADRGAVLSSRGPDRTLGNREDVRVVSSRKRRGRVCGGRRARAARQPLRGAALAPIDSGRRRRPRPRSGSATRGGSGARFGSVHRSSNEFGDAAEAQRGLHRGDRSRRAGRFSRWRVGPPSIRISSSPASNREDWKTLSSSGHPLLNRATQAAYPPGSTFKILTALAGLHVGGIISLRDDASLVRRRLLLRQQALSLPPEGRTRKSHPSRRHGPVLRRLFLPGRECGSESIASPSSQSRAASMRRPAIDLPQERGSLIPTIDWFRSARGGPPGRRRGPELRNRPRGVAPDALGAGPVRRRGRQRGDDPATPHRATGRAA